MNMRWGVVLGVVAILALAAVPVLAQGPAGYGGGMGMGGGMMGGGTAQGNGQPLSIDRAVELAREATARSGFSGLVPGHIMEFSNQFYVAVKEQGNGRGAFELLIDRYAGAVYPEPGPNMMWNAQYGHMSGSGFGMGAGGTGSGIMGAGMMGQGGFGMGGMGIGGTMGPGMMGPGVRPGTMGQPSVPTGSPVVTLGQARIQAQKFLDARFPGTRTAEATTFPGYYTIDVSRSGKMVSMLSVNAYTGQVWYHAWHGTFVQEKDVN